MSRLPSSQYRALRKGKRIAAPPGIQACIDTVLDQIETVLPGFIEALVLTKTKFIYDPQAEFLKSDPSFDSATQETASCFSRPHLTMFFDDAGLEKSLPHECAHWLDVWAGIGSWSHVPDFVSQIPFSVQSLYGNTSRDDFDPHRFLAELKSDAKALTLARIICSPRIVRDKQAQQNTLAMIANRDTKIADFILERWADFFEHHIWWSLARLGVSPVGFSPNRYVAETFWEDKRVEALDKDASQIWQAAIEQVFRLSTTKVNKIYAENRRLFKA